MSRVVARLIALIVALFGAITPGPGAAAAAPAAPTYGYNDHHDAASVAYTTTAERGPPAEHDRGTTYDAGAPRSHGAPARPLAATVAAIWTYNHDAPLAQAADVATTTQGSAEVTPEALSSLGPGRLAANAGDDLIRLSTKDSWANLKTLDDHFARHGADFGAMSADDYARMGSEFFQRGGAQRLPTKIAPDGTIRMHDPATNTFGSFAPNGMTKTLFKPTCPDYWSRQPGVLQ